MNDERPSATPAASPFDATRRTFLKYLGTAAAAGLVPEVLGGCASNVDAPAPVAATQQALAASIGPTGGTVVPGFAVTRARDSVSLHFDFINLHVDTTAKRIVPTVASSASFLIVRFPSLHIEEPINWAGLPFSPSRAAGESRLVFAMPAGFTGVDLKLDAVLDLCAKSPLNIAANAISEALAAQNDPLRYTAVDASVVNGTTATPPPDVTALEATYRLVLSPNENGRFTHAPSPVQSAATQRVELWNTRLVDGLTAGGRNVRAIYTRDWSNFVADVPFSSESGNEPIPSNIASATADPNYPFAHFHSARMDIVTQSANFITSAAPSAIAADKLVLTPMGATLDARGSWPTSPTVVSWKQRTSLGRDIYVQTVAVGYLLPFGLRATATLTAIRAQQSGCVTMQGQWSIHVLDATRDFGGPLPSREFRAMPFQRITLRQTSFDIDVPANAAGALFTATHDNQTIMIPVEAIDRRGKKIAFDIPLVWTPALNGGANASQYNASGPNVVSLGGQRLGVAPSTKDHTTIECSTVQWNVLASPPTGSFPVFYPYVTAFTGTCEAMRHFSPASAAPSPATFRYHADYALPPSASAIGNPSMPKDGSQAQVLLSLDAAQALSTTSDGSAGGLVKPDVAIGGIGMQLGAISDVSGVASGSFNPSQWFGSVGKLFGMINLSDFADSLTSLGGLPKIVAESYHAAERYAVEVEAMQQLLASAPAALSTTVAAVEAQLQTATSNAAALLANPNASTAATLLASIQKDIALLQSSLPMLQSALANPALPFSGLRGGMIARLAKVIPIVAAGFAPISDAIAKVQQGLDVVRDLKGKIEWRPQIAAGKNVPANVGLLTLNSANPLLLAVEMTGKTPGADGATVYCSLDDFTLNFPPNQLASPRVQLYFDRIFFRKEPNRKAEIDVNFKDIGFFKELSFIQDIRKLIPLDGFSDPPHVDVDATGIHASFSCGLPNLSFGVLSLENLKLSAGLDVPFVGEMTFGFSFCDRDHPFTATVAMLGGGGYFALQMGSDGNNAIKRLEASIDVCAQLSIDIGVASGSLSASAGVRYTYDSAAHIAALTGFVDLRGAVDVLGLICLSIEAKLELTYDFNSNSLVGSCTLTVDVEVAFFSTSVDLHFEKRFGGSGTSASTSARMLGAPLTSGTPTFFDLMNDFTDDANVVHHPWAEYVGAFAA